MSYTFLHRLCKKSMVETPFDFLNDEKFIDTWEKRHKERIRKV